MLWKIFSSVWLYCWKCYFLTNFSHGNSTHSSKLWQSKATTTKTPPPHHRNNNKNQNHIEIKITQRERSVGRRRDRAEARSKARSSGEIERHDAIGAVLWSTRLVRFGACDRRTRAHEIERSIARCNRRSAVIDKTGATGASDRRNGARGSPTIIELDWSSGFALFFLSLSLSLSLSENHLKWK